MYQFFRDVEDELAWIQDRRPLAESEDLGSSLTAVQNLMKKHQVKLTSIRVKNLNLTQNNGRGLFKTEKGLVINALAPLTVMKRIGSGQHLNTRLVVSANL